MDSRVLPCSLATPCRRSLPSALLAVVVALHPTPLTLLTRRGSGALALPASSTAGWPRGEQLAEEVCPRLCHLYPLILHFQLSNLLSTILGLIFLLYILTIKTSSRLPNPCFPNPPLIACDTFYVFRSCVFASKSYREGR